MRFFCLFFVFYSIGIVIFGKHAPTILQKNLKYKLGGIGHLHTRLSDIPNHLNSDILFLGSSHAFRGFDPRVFARNGYSSFNLGSSMQTPLQSRMLLRKYFDAVNPKVVVYEVYPLIFGNDGVESAIDFVSNDRCDLNTIRMVAEIRNIKVFNTLLYSVYMQSFGHFPSFREKVIIGDDRYISGGYVENHNTFDGVPEPRFPITYTFSDFQMRHFGEIMDFLRKRDVEVILVQAPVTSLVYDRITNKGEVDSVLSSYGRYYNFNQDRFLSDSLHFKDPDHLNNEGTALFNEKVLNVIQYKPRR